MSRNRGILANFGLTSTAAMLQFFNMDKQPPMKVSVEIKDPTPESPDKLEVKRLTTEEFAEYEGRIRGLTRNALNTKQGTGLSEYEKDVTDLDTKYLDVAKHGEMFIAVKGEQVLAFVGLIKSSEQTSTLAVINQVRYAGGLDHPERIIGEVLRGVKSSLDQEGVHRADIESDGEHHNLTSFEESSWFHSFTISDKNQDKNEKPAHSADAHV